MSSKKKVVQRDDQRRARAAGKGSEHELVSRACRLSGFTPDRIVHQGAQRFIAMIMIVHHACHTEMGGGHFGPDSIKTVYP